MYGFAAMRNFVMEVVCFRCVYAVGFWRIKRGSVEAECETGGLRTILYLEPSAPATFFQLLDFGRPSKNLPIR